MTRILLAAGVVALTVSLAAQGQAPAAPDLGGALGQQVRRPPPPTGPSPRLPDGTIDLGDGVWIGGGANASLAQGLTQGEELPLLPSAKTILASRKDTEDPYLWCLHSEPVRAMTPRPPGVEVRP